MRSPYFDTFEKASYYHYDFYSQALVKMIRNHTRDRQDVAQMIRDQKIEVKILLEMVGAVEADFLKYPRLDYANVIFKIEQWSI